MAFVCCDAGAALCMNAAPFAHRYCYVTIEQHLSAIRKWYDDVLKDSNVANPARNVRLEKVQKIMAKKLGRHRKHSPEVIKVAYVRAVYACMDLGNAEEVLTAAYMAKNLVKGTRAADEFLLDWTDVEFIAPSGSTAGGLHI